MSKAEIKYKQYLCYKCNGIHDTNSECHETERTAIIGTLKAEIAQLKADNAELKASQIESLAAFESISASLSKGWM